MKETMIGVPKRCKGCIFNDIVQEILTCRFYPKYTKIPLPLFRDSPQKPPFCRIKYIVVYEEPLEETWGSPEHK
jgi:hypothetical protein